MENIVNIAAFGGLILGFLNIGITIYKDFIKEGKLELLDEEFTIKKPEKYPEYFDVQIDLRFHAKKDDIYIKQVILKNKNDFTSNKYHPVNQLELRRAIPFKRLTLSNSNYKGFIDEMYEVFQEESFTLTDMKINKGGIKSLTYLARLKGVRESDGWEVIPEKDYQLIVSYGKKETIHSLSPKNITI